MTNSISLLPLSNPVICSSKSDKFGFPLLTLDSFFLFLKFIRIFFIYLDHDWLVSHIRDFVLDVVFCISSKQLCFGKQHSSKIYYQEYFEKKCGQSVFGRNGCVVLLPLPPFSFAFVKWNSFIFWLGYWFHVSYLSI